MASTLHVHPFNGTLPGTPRRRSHSAILLLHFRPTKRTKLSDTRRRRGRCYCKHHRQSFGKSIKTSRLAKRKTGMMRSSRRAKMAAIAVLIMLAIFNLLQSRWYHPKKAASTSMWSVKEEVSSASDTTGDRHETTIIITSSLIPSHPSLELINQTIASLCHIQGLPPQTPVIITVDGILQHDTNDRNPSTITSHKSIILEQYIQSLRDTYNEYSHITVLAQKTQMYLVGNVRQAIQQVQTEFVYMVQHDMPFIAPIHHSALVQTMIEFPDEVRMVRFSPRKTLARSRDKLGLCGSDVDLEANGIALAKTHTWSDNNHFTRKAYYDEMFSTIEGWDDGTRYMEKKMNIMGTQNCSYWGTYLYGKQGEGPAMIVHLDGADRKQHKQDSTNATTASLRRS